MPVALPLLDNQLGCRGVCCAVTQGDSFIMAFHLPKDALLFAMDGQVSLLTADWPFELLQTQVCKPVWVQGM